jgi:filamentous hemagglutinin family protein
VKELREPNRYQINSNVSTGWSIGLIYLLTASSSFLLPNLVAAQVIPDNTLGNERSVVVPISVGEDSITGGAQRGRNLFHSFREFNIGEGRQLYFANPSDVNRILTRVTGSSPSNLLGTLGVRGGADLVLMNPNGIVFGETAQLDVQGSLIVTTANAIQFGEQGFFSATNPETPSPLLTIDPSALWFNQLAVAPIIHRSRSPIRAEPPGFSETFGLQISDGRSLLLVGGNITLDGGGIVASGGRVNLVSLSEPGIVELFSQTDSLRPNVADSVPRGDVLLNGASIIVAGSGSGDVTIQARNISLFNNSAIEAGIARNLRTANQQADIIHLNATGTIQITDSSYIENSVFPDGIGNSGSLILEADRINVVGDNARLRTATFGNGNAGLLSINTRELTVAEGAQISASTFGNGNGGNVRIRASDSIQLSGESPEGTPGGIFAQVNKVAIGQGGRISVETDRLSISDGSSIQITTFGNGDAGRITIRANTIDLFVADPSTLFATGIVAGIEGNSPSYSSDRFGGTIHLNANLLNLRNNAQIRADSNGIGDAGRININAQAIELTDKSLIVGSVREGAIGDGSPIRIEARSLFAEGGSQIGSFVTRPLRRDGQLIPGGQGNGGDLSIRVSNTITLSGTSSDGFPSGIFSLVERDTRGNAGNIRIQAGNLRITDGAAIVASTYNDGAGGNITIDAGQITALNGGQIVTATRAEGAAGDIRLNVSDTVTLSGRDLNFADRRERARNGIQQRESSERVSDIIVNEGSASGIFANTASASEGQGGTITLHTTRLSLSDRARISAQSLGTGGAGDIFVNVRELMELTDSDIATAAPRSTGGDIRINTAEGYGSGLITLRGDSDITTVSQQDGGDIEMRAQAIIAFDDSDILTTSEDETGGNITLSSFFSQNDPYTGDPPLDGNDRVDINAEGQVRSGTISTPDTSTVQNSLADLPESAIDTESLITASCVVRSQEPGGTFIITGRGGLPERPGEGGRSVYSTGEVRSIPETSQTSWQMGDPIVEPQGMYQLEDGRMILSQECD